MALKMKGKFDKYWGSSNMLISFGAILDPRYKMELINFSFKIIYSEGLWEVEAQIVRDALEDLFEEYVEAHKESNNVQSNSGSGIKASTSNSSSFTTSRFSMNTGSAKFSQHIRSVNTVEHVKSELATYLDEGVYLCEADTKFNSLKWWKENRHKYRILSKMVADILSVLITTVASESAFSAGGRVIDPHRSCLGTETVDTLVCGADWYRHYYGLHKKKTKENGDIAYIMLE
ncbi:zinc finger BED domain-containing protein RICESLEEPER 1-like [Bidens hawaiensis]|uniref:zinc finger BED domain-containing protein RICESLEEPER 1-like n=1 Tax=Bidens hawaiensis TaxID=980011 RepID=UPI00404B30A6